MDERPTSFVPDWLSHLLNDRCGIRKCGIRETLAGELNE
jgi:hypothetical protein